MIHVIPQTPTLSEKSINSTLWEKKAVVAMIPL